MSLSDKAWQKWHAEQEAGTAEYLCAQVESYCTNSMSLSVEEVEPEEQAGMAVTGVHKRPKLPVVLLPWWWWWGLHSDDNNQKKHSCIEVFEMSP